MKPDTMNRAGSDTRRAVN